jgi:hypothetical protein
VNLLYILNFVVGSGISLERRKIMDTNTQAVERIICAIQAQIDAFNLPAFRDFWSDTDQCYVNGLMKAREIAEAVRNSMADHE